MFDPTSLPRHAGKLYLITDKLDAPSEFIVLSMLASHLRQAPRRKCILVSFAQAFSHWNSVASRLSPPTNLSAYVSKGTFSFIEALSESPISSDTTSLRSLYDRIDGLLEGVESNPEELDEVPNLVILDSISLLEWTGTPLVEVSRFVRALLALCRKCKAMLIVRHHRVTSENLDELHRALLSLCAVHLEILPLTSGRSSAISGEIVIHPGPLLDDPKSVPTIHRSAAVQYRLRDSGATYFSRGTSSVVL